MDNKQQPINPNSSDLKSKSLKIELLLFSISSTHNAIYVEFIGKIYYSNSYHR